MPSSGEDNDLTRIPDILPQGLITLDPRGTILYANSAAERVLGISRDQMSEKALWDLEDKFPPDFIDQVRSGQKHVAPAEYARNGLCVELSLMSLDDGTRVIQVREGPQHALHREITAREEAEAASAEIRSILERIGDAYIAFDTEWRYTYVNGKAAELAQKPASELIGRRVWDEFPEAVKTPFYSELHRAMREQRPVEFNNYFEPLGRWFENSVYPSPAGVGVYYRDITERVRTHRALERKTAELARKNSELEMFAYVASHDLQEPLRMIGSYAALLGRRYTGALDRDADEFIEFIVGGVDRMQRLIKNVLALCRLEQAEAPPWSPVDAKEIFDLACGNLDLSIEDSGASIECGELPVIEFEETQFLQLIQNLVSNALKYRRGAPRIVVAARRDGYGWIFSVGDNGIGFDRISAEQVFKPFKRLQNADDGGSGVGLAICKKIVESRGGRIWAESTPGVGSTFFFSIPDVLPARE
jgi:PAS domain S-box-containing protein